jgi:hypothetical protein
VGNLGNVYWSKDKNIFPNLWLNQLGWVNQLNMDVALFRAS